jgi:hypothetical protein
LKQFTCLKFQPGKPTTETNDLIDEAIAALMF